MAAAGINFIDIYQREGVYPVPTPFVVGGEGAGTVEAVGDGVELAAGDRVAWADGPAARPARSSWTPGGWSASQTASTSRSPGP